eukprot:scaffold50115_cov75-Phaeocystis_antarctica.AAC.1
MAFLKRALAPRKSCSAIRWAAFATNSAYTAAVSASARSASATCACSPSTACSCCAMPSSPAPTRFDRMLRAGLASLCSSHRAQTRSLPPAPQTQQTLLASGMGLCAFAYQVYCLRRQVTCLPSLPCCNRQWPVSSRAALAIFERVAISQRSARETCAVIRGYSPRYGRIHAGPALNARLSRAARTGGCAGLRDGVDRRRIQVLAGAHDFRRRQVRDRLGAAGRKLPDHVWAGEGVREPARRRSSGRARPAHLHGRGLARGRRHGSARHGGLQLVPRGPGGRVARPAAGLLLVHGHLRRGRPARAGAARRCRRPDRDPRLHGRRELRPLCVRPGQRCRGRRVAALRLAAGPRARVRRGERRLPARVARDRTARGSRGRRGGGRRGGGRRGRTHGRGGGAHGLGDAAGRGKRRGGRVAVGPARRVAGAPDGVRAGELPRPGADGAVRRGPRAQPEHGLRLGRHDAMARGARRRRRWQRGGACLSARPLTTPIPALTRA